MKMYEKPESQIVEFKALEENALQGWSAEDATSLPTIEGDVDKREDFSNP